MTISKKKQLAKTLARSDAQRFELEMTGRKGPGGIDLSVEEAINWFPTLTVQRLPFDGGIDPKCDVLVQYREIKIWLCDIEVSVEPGFYFGNIIDDLPENDATLASGNNIGFRREHVIRVRQQIDIIGKDHRLVGASA